jgi:cytochrome P450
MGILKDNPIGYSTLAMQRRQDLYPPPSPSFPPVDQFVPERWDNWVPKSWQYIPFNGGPRICIGQQFALMEMAYTIVRILQRYDRIECKMNEHPGLGADIVLAPVKAVKVAFYAATTSDKKGEVFSVGFAFSFLLFPRQLRFVYPMERCEGTRC